MPPDLTADELARAAGLDNLQALSDGTWIIDWSASPRTGTRRPRQQRQERVLSCFFRAEDMILNTEETLQDCLIKLDPVADLTGRGYFALARAGVDTASLVQWLDNQVWLAFPNTMRKRGIRLTWDVRSLFTKPGEALHILQMLGVSRLAASYYDSNAWLVAVAMQNTLLPE